MIENLYPEWYEKGKRGVYTPVKKIDMGNFYLVLVSGIQAPKNENHVVVTDDVEEQTEMVFEEISKLLQTANASIDDVVQARIFVTDMNDFEKISAIRGKWFAKAMPVSTLVEVNGMTRKGAKIEIEVTAIVKK